MNIEKVEKASSTLVFRFQKQHLLMTLFSIILAFLFQCLFRNLFTTSPPLPSRSKLLSKAYKFKAFKYA